MQDEQGGGSWRAGVSLVYSILFEIGVRPVGGT